MAPKVKIIIDKRKQQKSSSEQTKESPPEVHENPTEKTNRAQPEPPTGETTPSEETPQFKDTKPVWAKQLKK